MDAESKPHSEGFYFAAVLVSAYQIFAAVAVVAYIHSTPDVGPDIEFIVPLSALGLFLKFGGLLFKRNLPLAGLVARCAQTCAVAVWLMVFAMPLWYDWFSTYCMYRGAWGWWLI